MCHQTRQKLRNGYGQHQDAGMHTEIFINRKRKVEEGGAELENDRRLGTTSVGGWASERKYGGGGEESKERLKT